MNFKSSNKHINHTPIVKTLDIRLQYRIYLAEMEAYNFVPMSFRVWYSWHTKKPL